MDEPLLTLASHLQTLWHRRPYQWLVQSAQLASSSMHSSPPTYCKVLRLLGRVKLFKIWYVRVYCDVLNSQWKKYMQCCHMACKVIVILSLELLTLLFSRANLLRLKVWINLWPHDHGLKGTLFHSPLELLAVLCSRANLLRLKVWIYLW